MTPCDPFNPIAFIFVKVDMTNEVISEYKMNKLHYLLRDINVEVSKGIVRLQTTNKRWTLQVLCVWPSLSLSLSLSFSLSLSKLGLQSRVFYV